MNFLIYILLILFIIFDVVIIFISIEQMIHIIMNHAPSISAGLKSRQAIIDEIIKDFPNAKTIIDIGSGWGTMVNAVAKKNPNIKATGVEIMLAPFLFSYISALFKKNVKFVFGDAFKYLKNTNNKFDIGVAYLLSSEMKDVEKFLSNFDVLLALDFPIPNLEPIKKIRLHKDIIKQHWLYVYKK
ncbi:MAG: hypothetical protein JW974_03985 [Alphaproteobacteria bacterium]|nr:hypothetical protein [Alphaproteobacteria bacterium]MBN2675148.1 hypothetical protein [Alphaproteobacteria bacterium]